MQFKHPEILYALLLLLIPVIIHLVRWKKFKQKSFSNVEFLKDLEIKSRRSRKLKELIILLLRLLAIAMLVLAFAQPYFPSKAQKQKADEVQTIIYLDNSLSMSALTKNTNLWQEVRQDLVKNLDEQQLYTFFDNTETYKNISGKQLKAILYKVRFIAKPTHHKEMIKKANLLFAKDQKKHELIYISDLQNVDNEKLTSDLFRDDVHYNFYVKQQKELPNISLDTLWLQSKTNEVYTLNLQVSAMQKDLKSPVSIHQGNKLLWRGYVDFKDSLQQQLRIELPKSKNITARVSVVDRAFTFDNNLFFCLQENPKIRVLFVGNSFPDFIKNIYTDDEFQLDFSKPNQLNYGKLSSYDLLILDGINNAQTLSFDAIKQYLKNYGNLVLIPPVAQPEKIASTLNILQIPNKIQLDTTKVLLNDINFQHPIFKQVFLKKTRNFAYPFVRNHLLFERQGAWLYRLSDHSPFMQLFKNNGNIYVFNASLEASNTNFTQAPTLLVSLFYQIATNSNKTKALYYNIGQKNTYDVPAQIKNDAVLQLKKDSMAFIPFQINKFNKVQISTTDFPEVSGIYDIVNQDDVLKKVAYNYAQIEHRLQFVTLPQSKQISYLDSFKSYAQAQKDFLKEKSIWKYFLVLALFFLLLEILLILYWKP